MKAKSKPRGTTPRQFRLGEDTLAEALTAEQTRQGLSVNALAKRAGLSPSRVHGILTGDTPNPGIGTVRAVLAALGKSLSWLDRQLGPAA